ncbi:homoserine dehydrogenase [Roseiflexus sp.]|uniref:homoserine dehydrogenase n=1 Tax=Roseiflexus sp. TaxID=2562120 RepID=UPI00398B1CB2
MKSPVSTYRLALVGFGSVGRGLAEILSLHRQRFIDRNDADIRIVAVCTRRWCVYEPNGIDAATLLRAVASDAVGALPGACAWSADQMIASADADVLVEASPTDMATGEPATTYIRAAIARGMHVITANKGPIALHFAELRRLAAERGVMLGFEATVMSGTPALRLGWSDLAGCDIQEVRGIVNGTTNFILTRMERGMDYASALAEAQRLGYAETDPTGDVEGYDAAGKAAILANVLMNAHLTPADVEREGITGITRDMVAAASAAGERWKLIARVWRDGPTVRAAVRPMRLMLRHPLAGVDGATNALTIITDLLGDVTIIGPGAGGVATGFAILSDLLTLQQGVRHVSF